MAFQNTRHTESTMFDSGMNKDLDPQLVKGYTHAINSQLNSKSGNFPFIQNEPGTSSCINIPYTFNGSIPLKDNRYVIFSTNNSDSEIGIFNEKFCSYDTLINSTCLDFNIDHLIEGVSKQNSDGTETIYFCNNYNNNRCLNINKIPYKYTISDDDCNTKIYTDEVDCSELELNAFIKIPQINISKSTNRGNLINGQYQVVITYAINEQTVTDFYGATLPVSIFSHENIGGALDIELHNLDTDFPEYNLHVIVTVAQQTTCYKIGTYTTNQDKVTITTIRPTDIIIPLSNIFLQKIINDKAKNVVSINNQLVWSSPTVKQELNYQSLANDIKVEWIAYAVPIEDKNYDIQSFMRDEVYALGITWRYTDSSKTYTYPLIGRKSTNKDIEKVNTEDAYEFFLDNCDRKTDLRRWQVYNTATGIVYSEELDKCEYKIIGRGNFGYHESLEKYPDNKELYSDLACTPIRHFRFPDDSIVPRTLKNSKGIVTHLIHLGVSLSNIAHPEDYNGKKLKNIQGYEIYRADRNSEKTVIGKGLLFNMGEYENINSSKDKIPFLYPNYPYNDLSTDNFLSKTQTKGSNFKEKDYTPMGTFSKLYYTLHSPSFSFNKPSFGNELKIEGIEYGISKTNFEPVYNHPKNKLLTDTAFIVSSLLGIGEAYLATREKTIITTTSENMDYIVGGTTTPNPAGIQYTTDTAAYLAELEAIENANRLNPIGASEDIQKNLARTKYLAKLIPLVLNGTVKVTVSETEEKTAMSGIPKTLRILDGLFMFGYYFQQGVETGLNVLRTFSKSEQYAYQVNSYCNYTNFKSTTTKTKRRYIEDINYLYPTVQQFSNITVNNFKRESSVVLKLSRPLSFPGIKDTSRKTMSQASACDSKYYEGNASSYYVAIKQSLPSQYGQIQNIQWISTGTYVPIENPSEPENKYTTPLILGGDTFIGRFTVKRKQHYFNQTAFAENENFEFDYRKYINIPYPRYWMDTEAYDLSELVSFTPQLPNDKSHLDCGKSQSIKDKLKSPFVVRDKHFYLTNNGVIDFYVESEVNLSNRDWEEQPFYRHYDEDRYSNLTQLFRSDNLDYDNRYIYDKSYSKQLTENINFSQDINFDKDKVIDNSNRVYYSLPNNKDLIKDNWRIYLANNYYDFPLDNGNLTGMKVLDRTNMVFFFDKSGPYLHQAIDQLQTDSGLKIQIGDGGLFSRQPQPLITTDVNYGNSSVTKAYCTSQYGVFYPSPTNGRVFLLQGNALTEVSREGMSFWFQNNMQFNLTSDFPDYNNINNTVSGIGFTTIFDNTNETYYLSKIDFKVKDAFKSKISYNKTEDKFYLTQTNGYKTNITFKDPLYFDDASWAISYLPKLKCWVSFHDWHPNATIQTENHFITVTNPTKSNLCTLWKHNERCDRFCYYYNNQHSWDIEYPINNGQNTSTLSNIEYILESYKYDANCISTHHLLDYNFNRAYIYNTEQHSGLLKLNLATKNQISKILLYPKINGDSIDIEYHKEEQKFRFNQFWDICKNRAEFNNSFISMLLFDSNGYKFIPNPEYINYAKPPFERKKFRHNWNKVYLSRVNEQDEPMPHMIMKFSNAKNLISPR